MTKTGQGLAQYAISTLGCAYAYGVQGVVLTEALLQAKAAQYPSQYTPAYIARTREHSLGRVSYDCTTATDLYTGVDRSANGWQAAATEKGSISTMPDIVGLMVHKDGHMGVYIGNGEVVEARGVDYGVVKTKLSDRPWEHWAKVPGISYQPVYPVPTRTLRYIFGLIRGNDVKWLQQSLTNLGYDCGTIDGIFGKATLAAVKAYQRRNGLVIDGIVGPATRAAILADI